VLALSHRTTAIVYLATLVVLFLIDRRRRKVALLHALITGACLLAIDLQALSSAIRVPPEAIFTDWSTYLGLSFSLLLIIICGAGAFRNQCIPSIVIAFAIASFLFPILHTSFYERIFIFSDIALAILAGCALGYCLSVLDWENISVPHAARIAAICIALGILFGALVDQIRAYQPLVSAAAVESIKKNSLRVPPNATILTTSDEAPWFEGWTLSHIAAPGMLHDDHNLPQWIAFWSATSSAQKIAFLNDFSPPLYISTLGDFSTLLGSSTIPCLETISPDLWYDNCPQAK